MRKCPKCRNWNSGEGTRDCLVCKVIYRLANHNKPLKERLLPADFEGMLESRNYNEVIHEKVRILEMIETFNKMNSTHKAILALKAVQFKNTEIATILNVHRHTVSRALAPFYKEE